MSNVGLLFRFFIFFERLATKGSSRVIVLLKGRYITKEASNSYIARPRPVNMGVCMYMCGGNFDIVH